MEKLVADYYTRKPLVYVLNIVSTRQVAGAKRGARVKSVALAYEHPWVHVFKPILLLALDHFFEMPTLDVLKMVYDSIYDLQVSKFPTYSICQKRVFRLYFRNILHHQDNDFSARLICFKYYDPTSTF